MYLGRIRSCYSFFIDLNVGDINKSRKTVILQIYKPQLKNEEISILFPILTNIVIRKTLYIYYLTVQTQ